MLFFRRRKKRYNPYLNKIPKERNIPFKTITIDEAAENIINRKLTGLVILDVRSRREYMLAHVKGAINIQINDLNKWNKNLPEDKETKILIYCSSGHSAIKAAYLLSYLNYTNLYIWEGGSINSMISKKLVI